MVQYEQDQIFSRFPEEMTIVRCEKDKDPLKRQLVHVEKLKRNSFYEKIREHLYHYKRTKFTRDKLTRLLDLYFLIIWKRLVGRMRSRSLS